MDIRNQIKDLFFKYTIPLFVAIMLISVWFNMIKRDHQVKQSMLDLVNSRSGSDNILFCVDEMIFTRFNGYKISQALGPSRPVKVFTIKNPWANSHRLIIQELDKTCDSGS